MRPALLAALMLTALPAGAEGAPNLTFGTAVAPPGPVRQLVLAQDLFDIGLAREDAILLLTAIRLAHGTELRPATGWTQDGPGTPAPAARSGGLPGDPLDPEALPFAMMMAEGDASLADVAAGIEAGLETAPPGRGHVSQAEMLLPAGKSDRWRMAFNGSLPAEIALIAESSLGLTVTDEAGEVICTTPAPAPRAYCAFTPARNGFFTVTVSPPAEGDSHYRLITN